MINPNRVHRAKGTIVKLRPQGFNSLNEATVKLTNGHELTGWDCPTKFKVGDSVNIQASFSITADAYKINTFNRSKQR